MRITVLGGCAAYPTADLGCSGYLVEQDGYRLAEFEPGATFDIGPFQAVTWRLPHWVPNAGLRITAGGRVLLTHLWPGADSAEFVAAARAGFAEPVGTAVPGLRVDLE